MSDAGSPQFTIGLGDWVGEARAFTDQFDSSYWDDFRPCREEEIATCERALNRHLPDDFREFLLRVGAGKFGDRGQISTPEQIVLGCPGPLFFVLNSAKWATKDEHRRFYASRGEWNPRPDLFTSKAMRILGDVNLFDLLQIGSDGQCCYHQLNLASPPRPFGYCLLEPDRIIDDALPTFSDGLKNILALAWRDANGLNESDGLLLNLSDVFVELEDGKRVRLEDWHEHRTDHGDDE